MMIYDDLWWSMMIYDDLWWSMMIYDDLWWSMMIYDDLWIYHVYWFVLSWISSFSCITTVLQGWEIHVFAAASSHWRCWTLKSTGNDAVIWFGWCLVGVWFPCFPWAKLQSWWNLIPSFCEALLKFVVWYGPQMDWDNGVDLRRGLVSNRGTFGPHLRLLLSSAPSPCWDARVLLYTWTDTFRCFLSHGGTPSYHPN